MKPINKIVIAVASFLTLAASSAYAFVVYPNCASGTVTSVGAGYKYTQPATYNGYVVTAQRSITLTCDSDIGFGVATARTFLIPATPDKDGIYNAALNAMVAGKKVAYTLTTTDEPSYGTTKGKVLMFSVIAPLQ